MRIIAGAAKGKKLKSLPGVETRPLLEKIRGALFNALGNVEGLRVLDLFAGTGAVGIEALSRGADLAVFVDSGAAQCRIIKENTSQFADSTVILQMDSVKAVRKLNSENNRFDFIFADPPYGKGLAAEILSGICGSNLLVRRGLIALTVGKQDPLPETEQECQSVFDRLYGQTRLKIYRRI
jgi:16S rRNA (guanine(966)-N(2))-methyltransferase RsmD